MTETCPVLNDKEDLLLSTKALYLSFLWAFSTCRTFLLAVSYMMPRITLDGQSITLIG